MHLMHPQATGCEVPEVTMHQRFATLIFSPETKECVVQGAMELMAAKG